MLHLSFEFQAIGLFMLAIAAWLRFGARPGLAALVAAIAASARP